MMSSAYIRFTMAKATGIHKTVRLIKLFVGSATGQKEMIGLRNGEEL